MESSHSNPLLPETYPNDALWFLSTWFKGEDPDRLIGLNRKSGTGMWEFHFWSLRDVYRVIYEDGLDGFAMTGANIYVNVCSLRERPSMGRGKAQHMLHAFGVWADLDVKDGAFRSEEHVDDFLRNLEIPPSLVVGSGSGGRHVYWPVTEVFDADEGARLTKAWLDHLREVAGEGIGIDSVGDPTRVLRLPGTHHWNGAGPRPVRLKMLDAERRTAADTIRGIARPAAERASERLRRIRASVEEQPLVVPSSLGQWPMYLLKARAEKYFARAVTWDWILVNAGWTFKRRDAEGRAEWQRPTIPGEGREPNPKTATTDWPQNPDIMSMFSDAPGTGLLELHQARVPLTKWRVFCTLYFSGDESAALNYCLEHGIIRLGQRFD